MAKSGMSMAFSGLIWAAFALGGCSISPSVFPSILPSPENRLTRSPEALGITRGCLTPLVQNKKAGYKPSTWSVAVVNAPRLQDFQDALSKVRAPSISAKDVVDRQVRFTADPFLINHTARWYLFFEIMNCFSEQGDIGFAESIDGITWQYSGVALDEPFHLSYPHVFKTDGEIYMIPETRQGGGIRLYRAAPFPTHWEYQGTLASGDYADPSIFWHEKRWWILAVEGGYSLAIFYADSLHGPFTKHRDAPFFRDDKSRTRPGGRVVRDGEKLIRFAQDNRQRYGHQVRAFEITTLTPEKFEEQEFAPDPFLFPSGSGWRGVGIHHIDPHQLQDGSWIAAVDGAGSIELGSSP